MNSGLRAGVVEAPENDENNLVAAIAPTPVAARAEAPRTAVLRLS